MESEPAMQTTEYELRERISLLEEENIQLRKALLPLENPFLKMDLTPQQRAIIYALYRADVASYEHLDRVMAEWSTLERADGDAATSLRLKVTICKLRRRLAAYGVKISTVHAVGYFIDAKSKEILAGLINGEN